MKTSTLLALMVMLEYFTQPFRTPLNFSAWIARFARAEMRVNLTTLDRRRQEGARETDRGRAHLRRITSSSSGAADHALYEKLKQDTTPLGKARGCATSGSTKAPWSRSRRPPAFFPGCPRRSRPARISIPRT